MASIGQIIDHKYEVILEIGHGGMSTVYLAIDHRLNKKWAIKEIRRTSDEHKNEIIIKSLYTEANLMKKMDHPALPRIVDIIEECNTIYVVMDYVEGKSMDVLLNEQRKIPQEYVIKWAKQLCEALSYLHNCKPAIIYRDMKPANIMVKPDGNIKLIDFGIAREYKQNHDMDTTCLGTRGYAAPEQFGGKGQTDPRTDIYCLGVTLYHMVTGEDPTEPPYQLYPIRMFDQTLSEGLEKILIKCTESAPEDRYQSCEELLEDLEHYNEMDDAYIWIKRKKRILFYTSVILCMLCGGAGIFLQHKATIHSKQYYLKLIQEAQNQENDELRILKYQEAIRIFPEREEGYLGWIETIKTNDEKFTVEEEKELIAVVNQNKQKLSQNNNDYIDICYEIAMLYWYYYDDGIMNEKVFARTIDAIPWFGEVMRLSDASNEIYHICEMYQDIGIFNRDYSRYIQEATINEEVKEYWECLLEFENYLDPSGHDELMIWEGYRIELDSIDVYFDKFGGAGIKNSEIMAVYDRLMEGLDGLQATSEATKAIQKEIKRRTENLLEKMK